MIVLSCSNISKTFFVDPIIENIAFSINNGEKIGLVGANGAGKSTLFKIIAGEMSQDTGDIFMPKDIKCGYLEQNTHITSHHTVLEEARQVFKALMDMEADLRSLEAQIADMADTSDEKMNRLLDDYAHLSEKFAESNGYGYESEIKGVLKGLGFAENEFDKTIDQLSGGQKTRVIMAKLLLQKPDIMLLDEPTNHLDIDAIEWLERFVKDYRGAVVIVSHDRYFLDATVDKIFHLSHNHLNIYTGNYTTFIEKQDIARELQEKKYVEQQKDIKKQEEMIRTFMQRGSKRNIRQAKSRQVKLDKVELLDRPDAEEAQVRLKFSPAIESGKDVLKVDAMSKSFGDMTLFKDLCFDIYRGDKIGLIGPNGVGKTSLFKILLGLLPADSGDIWKGSNVHLGYYDQEQTNLTLTKTVIDEIWDEHPTMTRYEIMSLLARFLFTGDDLDKRIDSLSGGEKGRLSLLKLMLSESNLLLMDEPTNHLDIYSKESLEEALLDYTGTLLVISHDRYFLNKVANKIYELTPQGLTSYLGNYDYYQHKKAELNMPQEEELEDKTKTQMKLDRKKEKEAQRNLKQIRSQIESSEAEIHQLETEIEEINTRLCEPEVFNDHVLSLELHQSLETAQENLANLYEIWENLQLEYESLQ